MERNVVLYAYKNMDIKEFAFVQKIFIYVKKNANSKIKPKDARNCAQNIMGIKINMNAVVIIYAINIAFTFYYLKTIQRCVKVVRNFVI